MGVRVMNSELVIESFCKTVADPMDHDDKSQFEVIVESWKKVCQL
jgi:hypothetical protein